MKRETEEALGVGFAVVTETQADGDEKSGAGLPFMERPSGGPSGELGSGSGVTQGQRRLRGFRSRNGRCPELVEVEVSEAVRSCFGPAEVRNRELFGAGRVSAGDDLPQLH